MLLDVPFGFRLSMWSLLSKLKKSTVCAFSVFVFAMFPALASVCCRRSEVCVRPLLDNREQFTVYLRMLPTTHSLTASHRPQYILQFHVARVSQAALSLD